MEGIHQNGETWKSHKNPCVSCQCREGVVSCSRPPCPASCPSSSSNSSKHNATDPSCCPQCRNSFGRTSSASSRNRQCRHQGLANVTFDSGQRWIYQCQSCECLVSFQINFRLTAVPSLKSFSSSSMEKRTAGRWNVRQSTAATQYGSRVIVALAVRKTTLAASLWTTMTSMTANRETEGAIIKVSITRRAPSGPPGWMVAPPADAR